jgi:hypothetical protein
MPEFLLPPLDCGLPLFAYGLLKPDELGYHRIATLVGRVEPALLRGTRLRVRDGLPLLVDDPDGHVEGVLLFPKSGKEAGFYQAVAAFEPARQYEQFTAIGSSLSSHVSVMPAGSSTSSRYASYRGRPVSASMMSPASRKPVSV